MITNGFIGCLVVILFLTPLMIIGRLLRYFGVDVYRTESWWPLHSLMILGAALAFIVGHSANRRMLEDVIYEKSGPVILFESRYKIFRIPVEYWGAILLIVYFGVVALRYYR